MTTLIAVYTNDGCVGRCDAKCYKAHEPECNCICHNRNHGVGFTNAVSNTRMMAEEWVDSYSKEHKLMGAYFKIPAKDPVQMKLI